MSVSAEELCERAEIFVLCRLSSCEDDIMSRKLIDERKGQHGVVVEVLAGLVSAYAHGAGEVTAFGEENIDLQEISAPLHEKAGH